MKKRRMLSGALALVMSLMVLASPALAAEAVSDGEMPAAVETDPAVPETEETTTPGEPPVESQEPPAEEPADPAPEQPEEPAPPESPSEVPAGPALRQDHVRYMEGFPQGTFQPEKQLTRAQAAQLVYRLLAQPESGTGDCSYTDVPSSQWYAQPVRALCALGLFDNGTTFRPEAVITRAEFVDLLVRLKPQAEGTAVFPDVPATHWAAKQIGVAAAQGWIAGYPDGTFRPEKGLTRAEACTVVNRMLGRTGDAAQANKLLTLGLFSDMTAAHWAAVAVASHWQTGGLNSVLAALNAALAAPFALRWTEHSARFLLLFTLTYAVAAVVLVSDKCNTRPGAEHGSACWGDVSALNRKYRDKHGTNLLLTKHFQIGVDGYKHKHNTNVLVIGGSGAGKTRTYAVPNVLQAGCSMVITDPKAGILRKTGAFLLAQGYEVRVFDLIDPSASFCYNPFCYVQSDKDVLQLIADLIQNTTPPNAHENDPFWSKAETALLQALMLYLIHEAPADEQNFAMVMEMIAAAEVREDDADYQSPLDILFERLEMREPDSIACKQYRIFKQAAGKTARSILVSVGVRLAAFNLPQIARLTMADELHLEELGERKIALFCCIPDSDKSLNYLVGMIYSQLIQTLYRQADRVHRGRLPVPVHLLIDEFPNISLPKDSFLSALATMRSRGIFCSIIAQNMAQLKAMYKNDWESLVGLCDEFLYLGGNEQGTHKYVSELIGKETISIASYNRSRGRNGSYSVNRQTSGRELLKPDEVRLLGDDKAILFVRGERPILDDKYDLLRHPNIRFTEDGGASPYDYTAAAGAANDLPGQPEQYELLDMDDFEDKPKVSAQQNLQTNLIYRNRR